MADPTKIDIQKLLNDPAHQGDRDAIAAVVDWRLKQLADAAPKEDTRGWLQKLFDGPLPPADKK